MNKTNIFLSSLTLCCFFAACQSDPEAEKITDYRYIIRDGELRISYIADVEEVIIPPFITVDGEDYPVVSIGETAGKNMENLKRLYLPSTIKSIGKDAFNGTYLDEVHIEDLSAWCNIDFKYDVGGGNHFYYNSWASPFSENTILYVKGERIKDLIIPNDVEKINNFAFYGLRCESVVMGDNVKTVGIKAFYENTTLEYLDLGSSVETVDQEAFSYCEALKSINLSPRLTLMALDAFYSFQNTGVEEVNSPDIATIAYLTAGIKDGWLPFNNAYTLLIDGKSEENIAIPFIKETLPDYCLNGAKNIKSIECEEGIISTGELSFSECDALERVVLPSTLKYFISDFMYTENFRTLVVKSPEPPKVGRFGPFMPIEGSTLYVPAQSIDLYRKADGWDKFIYILPIEDIPAN